MNSSIDSPDNITAEGEAYPSAPRRLQFLDLEPPAPGETLPIAPGVRWCRIPLPIDLNHINVWLLEHEDGFIVVDTGIAAPLGKQAWKRVEATLFAGAPLKGVFVTHMHPDHAGLARWLQERHRVPVWTSMRTYEQLRDFLGEDGRQTAVDARRFFKRHGLTDETRIPDFSSTRMADIVSGLPHVDTPVRDEERLSWSGGRWRAFETNGHAEGHLCLHDASHGLLISGDQVLPSISSNVGYTWRNQDPDPLGSFLASLERLRALSADTLVLPAHGLPFRGLRQRVDDLRDHHLEQLDKITAACASPKTVVELLPVMFRRSLKDMHFVLATAEAVAHAEFLAARGRLQRIENGSGVVRYAAR